MHHYNHVRLHNTIGYVAPIAKLEGWETVIFAEQENLKRETLPVVDSNRRFVGMVERTQLTASLIIDFAKKLESIK